MLDVIPTGSVTNMKVEEHADSYVIEICNFSKSVPKEINTHFLYSPIFEDCNCEIRWMKVTDKVISINTRIRVPLEEDQIEVQTFDARYSVVDWQGESVHLRTVPLVRSMLGGRVKSLFYWYEHTRLDFAIHDYICGDSVSILVNFHMKRPNFTSKYVELFNKYYYGSKFLNEFEYDVVLVSDDVKFKVHANVIKRNSSVLYKKIEWNKHVNAATVTTVKVNYRAIYLQKVVEFIYSGKLSNLDHLDYEFASDLAIIANELKIPGLEDECLKFYLKSITPESFCDVFDLSHIKNWKNLMIQCDHYIRYNKTAILKSQSYRNYVQSYPRPATKILRRKLSATYPTVRSRHEPRLPGIQK